MVEREFILEALAKRYLEDLYERCCGQHLEMWTEIGCIRMTTLKKLIKEFKIGEQ